MRTYNMYSLICINRKNNKSIGGSICQHFAFPQVCQLLSKSFKIDFEYFTLIKLLLWRILFKQINALYLYKMLLKTVWKTYVSFKTPNFRKKPLYNHGRRYFLSFLTCEETLSQSVNNNASLTPRLRNLKEKNLKIM